MKDPVFSRRSIRRYTAEDVPDETVERLLRAAMAAPSAGDQRPWRFVVVREREPLRAIEDFHGYAAMLPGAPVVLVVCGAPEGCRWPEMWSQDCAAATENILIEAEVLGLGAVWVGVHPFAERENGVRELLGIPEHIVPFSLVPVGRPAERKGPSDRYDPSLVHHERW